jgi:hypothetical protein
MAYLERNIIGAQACKKSEALVAGPPRSEHISAIYEL